MVDVISEDDGRTEVVASANGQTAFAADFLLKSGERVNVYHVAASGGTITGPLVEDTDYSLSGLGVDTGFTITLLPGGAFPSGALQNDVIVAQRDLMVKLAADFPPAGDFSATQINAAIGLLTRIAQDIDGQVSRSIRLAPSAIYAGDLFVPEPEANKVLAFNATADALILVDTGAAAPVDSVNGQTGVVVLDADDISDAATVNKFATAAELSKLAGIEAGAEVNDVASVNGQTGAVVLDADDISDAATANKFASAAELSKLAGIEAGADVTDNANVMAAIDIGALPQELAPASGDWLFMEDAGGVLRKVDWADLPAGGGGGLANVVEDLTPQLGGSLDVNGQGIVSVANGDIPITPNGTGSIILDGLSWPQADGTNGQVLQTNGAGQLSWVTGGGGGLANVVEDLTPQAGGDFDMNGNRLLLAAGAEATPSLTFGGDLDNGFYLRSPNDIGLVLGGALTAFFNTTQFNITPRLRAGNGDAAQPIYSFSGDVDTGLYSVGANQLGVSVGATLRVTFNTGNLTSTVPVLAPNGAVGAPAFAFSADATTGLYRTAGGLPAISVGGAIKAQFGTGVADFFTNISVGDQIIQRFVAQDFAIQSASPSSSAGVLTLDYSAGPDFSVTMSENITSIVISNPPASGDLAKITLELKQPTSGTHTLTDSSTDYGDAGAPTMPTGTGASMEISIWSRDGFSTRKGSVYFEKTGA